MDAGRFEGEIMAFHSSVLGRLEGFEIAVGGFEMPWEGRTDCDVDRFNGS
jgi:hypothetical protein